MQSLSQSSEALTREDLQIFLVSFHQLSLSQRKTVLLELVQIMSTSKDNLYFLLLLDYWMFHFYEIPAELIEQMQQIITKNEPTVVTSPFTQILAKTKATQLDGFALKTLYQSASYHSFYNVSRPPRFAQLSTKDQSSVFDLLV